MRILATIALAIAPLLAAAQEADTPGRVGRIAFIEGSAAVYQDPDQGWDKAYVNSPFTSENSVWTDPGSHVELRVGSTAVRLDETTQIDISRLDDDALDAFIPRGSVAVRVRHYDQAFNLRFDTPYARFTLRADGRYRIDVDPERMESRITVLTGDARVGSDSGNLRAGPGQTVRVFGGDSPSYVVEAAMRDPFDHWSVARDSRWVETNAAALRLHRHDGLRGSRQQRPMGERTRLRRALVSDPGRRRLGTLSPWPLGLRASVGLDVDRRCVVGLRAVPLRPLGLRRAIAGHGIRACANARPVWAPALVAWVGGAGFSGWRVDARPWAGIRFRRGIAISRGIAPVPRT